MTASAGRAAIHGTVTSCIVALRIVAAVLSVAADVLRKIADVMVVGRGAPKTAANPQQSGAMQLTI